ncbi:hypothetical protein ANANG_G00133640 [Anguilla anguilla]|uniref:Uncharacterized protein n=1 Tax=Anguilla anguilla TaxID=7936 RepID=A0A9D3M9L7_ANGAN|nr:hypothetical protein ANANG_G00133640 [Anguilla anguilla]
MANSTKIHRRLLSFPARFWTRQGDTGRLVDRPFTLLRSEARDVSSSGAVPREEGWGDIFEVKNALRTGGGTRAGGVIKRSSGP